MAVHTPTHKHTGAIYTPAWIVDLMCSTLRVPMTPEPIHILDPSCGDGAFLVPIATRWIAHAIAQGWDETTARDHITPYLHGYDIDRYAIDALRRRLDGLIAPHGWAPWPWAVKEANALDPTHRAAIQGRMDIVIGNPPYVRIHNLPPDQRTLVRALPSCASGMTDLYIAFYDLGFDALSPTGRMGYITPNSWMHSQAGRALRTRMATEQRLQSVQDLRTIQPFPGVDTYTSIQYLTPPHGAPTYTYSIMDAHTHDMRTIAERPALDLLTARWYTPTPQASIPLTTLRDHVRITVGLATLADRIFFVQPDPGACPTDTPTGTMAIQGPHGRAYIEDAILRPCIKASTWTGGAHNYHAIFPYTHINGQAVIIPEDTMAQDFPHAYAYLRTCADTLLQRDRGRPNPVAWYAYGRTQGLTTAFGPAVITSPINTAPNFHVLDDANACVMAGYILTWTDRPNTPGTLRLLQSLLNTEAMAAWVRDAGGGFKDGWHSYRKGAIQDFPFAPPAPDAVS